MLVVDSVIPGTHATRTGNEPCVRWESNSGVKVTLSVVRQISQESRKRRRTRAPLSYRETGKANSDCNYTGKSQTGGHTVL